MSIGEAKYFYDNFFGAVVMDQRSNRILQIAALARAETKPSESLIIVGDDWSPEIPYYAQRKSLALPYWAPAKFMAELVVSPSRFLGDSPLGGIIECGADLSLYTSRRPVIARLLSNRRVLGQAGGCRMLSGAVYAGPPDRRRHKPKRTDSG
jgi:hypothetical protein